MFANPPLHKVKRRGELLTPRDDWTTVLGDESVAVTLARVEVKLRPKCTFGPKFNLERPG